ncbi:MAG: CPBP family intramembrane glutamic endopeptidase [Gemmatimonas sp.]|nr:CPBP family intramembrane glutamic endopeptidase [Gemmatimonadaceae bacterium]
MERTRGTLNAELATFLLLTFGLSTGFYIFFAHAKTLNVAGGLFVGMLMWCPGVSALVTRLIFQRNVRGEGWAWGPSRYELAGYLLPIAYAVCAYAAVWIFDFGRVDLGRFKTNPLMFLTAGLALNLAFALGEELGWRGFLVPKLAERFSFATTAFVSGIIWASWHMPLIIFADYNGGTPTLYSIACFAIMVVGISFPFAWLRLRSGSVWPVAILHASHNLFIQGFFDQVTVDTGITKYLLSEFGAVLALAAAITGWLFWRIDRKHPALGISSTLAAGVAGKSLSAKAVRP